MATVTGSVRGSEDRGPRCRRKTGVRLAVWIAVVGLMIGCASEPSAPAVSETEARSTADDMLNAYNSDDYESASREWSDELKDEIDRSTFESSRDQILAKKGRDVEIVGVELAPEQPDEDVTWYEFGARFEKDDNVLFLIAFDVESQKVAGAELQAAG
jgi:hypothetical protein